MQILFFLFLQSATFKVLTDKIIEVVINAEVSIAVVLSQLSSSAGWFIRFGPWKLTQQNLIWL